MHAYIYMHKKRLFSAQHTASRRGKLEKIEIWKKCKQCIVAIFPTYLKSLTRFGYSLSNLYGCAIKINKVNPKNSGWPCAKDHMRKVTSALNETVNLLPPSFLDRPRFPIKGFQFRDLAAFMATFQLNSTQRRRLTCIEKLTYSKLNLPHGTKQKRLIKKLKIKTEMLRRNGPVIKPWSESWGRRGVYGGKDLWKGRSWGGSERERELWMVRVVSWESKKMWQEHQQGSQRQRVWNEVDGEN